MIYYVHLLCILYILIKWVTGRIIHLLWWNQFLHQDLERRRQTSLKETTSVTCAPEHSSRRTAFANTLRHIVAPPNTTCVLYVASASPLCLPSPSTRCGFMLLLFACMSFVSQGIFSQVQLHSSHVVFCFLYTFPFHWFLFFFVLNCLECFELKL